MNAPGKPATFCLGLTLALTLALPLVTPATSDARVNRNEFIDISVGAERMSGDSTYEIGGKAVFDDGTEYTYQSPLSKLQWPLDIWLARVDTTFKLGGPLRINGTVKKDLSDPEEPLEDSDYGIWYLSGYDTSENDLDVYSESDITDFEALILDVDLEWLIPLARGGSFIYLGAGYQYQNFEYEGSLNYQTTYYDGEPSYTTYGDDETAITYDVTYHMPYVLLGTELQMGKNSKVDVSVAYAPWVTAEDEDNHLLRENDGKISTGDLEGSAFMVQFAINHHLTPVLFLEYGASYTSIDTDGTQHQVYGNGEVIGDIDQTLESSQLSGFVKLGLSL